MDRFLIFHFLLANIGLSSVYIPYFWDNCLSLQETAAACCEAICKTVIKADDKWKTGRTKIFLKVQILNNVFTTTDTA